MKTPVAPQIIYQNGEPAFAVIPWDEYQRLINTQYDAEETDVRFPRDVLEANAIQEENLIKTWREYFNLTRQELAERTGLTKFAITRMEENDTSTRTATLKKIASAMNLSVEQLKEG
ncbi:MAG: helix-turn-helix domain-containing protein [Desulfobacteraceae bacterium]